MAQIDDFKANLIGGGARANQFRITITPPPGIAIGLDVRRTSFLVTAAQIPDIVMNFIAVPFRGRNIQYIGDRADPADWTVTFYNDTDFMIRNAMERWQNGINNHKANTGLVNPVDYQADLKVEQLDRDESVIKTYNFRGAFPINISAIDLNYETVDTIEEFTVEFAIQYWESNTTS